MKRQKAEFSSGVSSAASETVSYPAEKGDKAFRLMRMHAALMRGAELVKADIMQEYDISEKTARRDIDDLRAFLAEDSGASLEYDRRRKSYRMVRHQREWMTNEDILIIAKILLESRAFPKEEMNSLLDKLTQQAAPDVRRFIRDMLKNERFCYVEPRHGRRVTQTVWKLSRLIHDKMVTHFTYTRQDGRTGARTVKPVAIMFSEFYFYLVAFIVGRDDEHPAIFRVDRIKDIKTDGEKFFMPYQEKFSDGEFRKRVQFMYAGPLQRVTFNFWGPSPEAVLDRLPTAEVTYAHADGSFTITAEAYGNGIDMWLRSQGDYVRNVKFEPLE